MCPSGRIASPGSSPLSEPCCGQKSTYWTCSVAMGQPKVASAIWRDRNRRISRGSYEAVGQQTVETVAAIAGQTCTHVKLLNHVWKRRAQFPREMRGKWRILPLMGRLCFWFIAKPENQRFSRPRHTSSYQIKPKEKTKN